MPSNGRILAFLGLVPLGAFVVVHLITTATALVGAPRFDHVFARNPTLTAATLLIILVPLLVHAAWGMWVVSHSPRPADLPSWRPRLRRWSAMVTLVFIAGHVVELPLQRWLGRLPSDALYEVTESHLSSTWHSLPLVALAYLVGTAATLFHFGSAAWAVFRASGVTVSPRTGAAIKWGVILGTSALFLLATNTIVYLATGSRLLGRAPQVMPDGPPAPECLPKS